MSDFSNITVGGDQDFGSLGTFKMPIYSSDPSGGVAGQQYYNSTTGIFKGFGASGWSNITASAGTHSLDAAYNNGAAIAVDSGAIAITGSHGSNDAFTITHASAGTGDLIELTGDNTGELLKMTSTAQAAAVSLTANSVTTTDAVTITANGLTTGNALRVVSSGTVTSGGDGVVHIAGTGVTSGDLLYLSATEATLDGGNYISCRDSSTVVFKVAEDGVTTIGGASEGTDALVITVGDITLSDGDLTLSGGELAITDGVTTSGAGLTVTTSATTGGDGILVTANSLTTGSAIKAISSGTVTSSGTGIVEITTTGMTTGNALQIRVKEATLDGGNYISLYDTTGGTQIWSVGEDGNQTIAGTASGTDALILTAGDLTLISGDILLTSGDLTLAAGDLAITGNLTLTGDLTVTGDLVFSTTTFSWTATSTTDTNFTFTAAAQAVAGFLLDADSVTTGKGLHVTADGMTSGTVLYLSVTEATLSGGKYIECYSETGTQVNWSVAEDGNQVIRGTAAGTSALTLTTGDITVTSGDVAISAGKLAIIEANNGVGLSVVNNTITTSNAMVDISSSSLSTGALMRLTTSHDDHDGEVLEIISGGDATSTGKGISIDIDTVTTGAAHGISIVGANCSSGVKGIGMTFNAITSGAFIDLNASGATMSSGWFLRCKDDGTDYFEIIDDGATLITNAVATSTGLTIAGIWTSGWGMIIDNVSGLVGDNKALLKLDAGGANASGSNMLRLEANGAISAGAIAVEVVGTGKVIRGIVTDTDGTADSANTFHCGGALTNGNAVVEVTQDGNLATGGVGLLITCTGGSNDAASGAFEIAAAKDMLGILASTATATGDGYSFTTTGATAANKSVMHVEATGTAANDNSRVLTVKYGGTATQESRGIFVDGGGKDITGLMIDCDPVESAGNDAGHITLFSDAAGDLPVIINSYHQDAGAANGEDVFRLNFYGSDDTPAKELYGTIECTIDDVTNANPDATVWISGDLAGTNTRSAGFTGNMVKLGAAAATLTTGGAWDLTISTNLTAGNEPKIVMTDGASGNIAITAGGTDGEIVFASPVAITSEEDVDAADPSLTTAITIIKSGGVRAQTLDNHTVEGFIKYIIMDTDGGNYTLTITTGHTITQIVFDSVGDTATLMWIDGAWALIGQNAVAVT